MKITAHVLPALLALTLAACGQKGPLYLPDTTHGEVITRPAPADAGTSNSPASPDSPQQSTSPAPEVTAPEAAAPESPAPPDQDAKPDEKNKQNGATPPK
jgi:predicted small lipoprotein YifL